MNTDFVRLNGRRESMSGAADAKIRVGIDLGGTKIEIIALDRQGAELMRRRRPTPVGDYSKTLVTIVTLIAEVERELSVKVSVGIGTPGAISKTTGHLKNSNSICLNGQPLVTDLQNALGREVRIANDADCFTLSEATDGSAANAAVVFGVILGTGVGGGVVVNGRLLNGPNAIAGEWGHNPLPWPKESERDFRACYCGKSDCIETYLSGSGLSVRHELRYGVSMQAKEIMQSAEDGEMDCARSLDDYSDRLARSLAHVINILDPDVIVLGGGLSNCATLYQSVPKKWARYVLSDRVDTRLVAPKYGDSSGVRGAAWLWNAP